LSFKKPKFLAHKVQSQIHEMRTSGTLFWKTGIFKASLDFERPARYFWNLGVSNILSPLLCVNVNGKP